MDIDGVFQGGGIRGTALAGAAAAALDAGYAFRRAAGTSAGAIVASLVAAGYDGDELREAVCKADWPPLLDPMPWTRIPGIGKHISLMLHHGMYRGRMLEERWGRLLAAKGVRTFGDLSPGSLKLVATDITHQSGAVLMSDGAMASRFPLEVLQPSEGRPIVGFRLSDDDATHEHVPIRGPIALAIAVIGSGMGARETLPCLALEPSRVVTVPAERDVLDFDITP